MKTNKKPWYKRWTVWSVAFLVFTAFAATMGALLPEIEEAAPAIVEAESTETAEDVAGKAKAVEDKAAKKAAKLAKEKAEADAENARKEAEQATVDKTLADFETYKAMLIESSGGIITDVTAEYSSHYRADVFVDESAWAVSSESEKTSFATTISTAIKKVLDENAFVDIRSATNNDIVAKEKIFGGYDIIR